MTRRMGAFADAVLGATRDPLGRLSAAGGLLAILAVPLFAAPPAGQLDWPEEWVVFAPFRREEPIPPPATLAAVPQRLMRSDGVVVTGRTVRVARGGRLDLKDFFPSAGIGNTAWVFIPVESARAQAATIGLGADWWFRAWLNGVGILATPETGNRAWPPSVIDHITNAPFRPGRNVLAVRVVSGSASALFAAGGPVEIAAATGRIGGPADPLRFNRPVPLAERIPYEPDRQALATAERPFGFPEAGVDLAAGALAGLQRMPKRQLHLSRLHLNREVHDTEYRRFPFEPVKLLLSKRQYPAEDRHLDVVLWTSPPEGVRHEGAIELALKTDRGGVLARESLPEVSPTGWFFSLGIPPALIGRGGRLEAVWRQGTQVVARVEEPFTVMPPAAVAVSGRIPIRLLNGPGVTLSGAPMTVGVPFPHGALYDERRVRLVDERGAEMPLQTKTTARWSRYGAIQWLLCDFTADLAGTARTVFIEYGPNVTRAARAAMGVTRPSTGFPTIDAGRLKVSAGGLGFDPAGTGVARMVLGADALQGAFVLHEDGRRFAVPADVRHEVEESGSEKTVVRRTGWYVDARSGGRFCQFVTRFVFHRNSPVVRLYHTWIFTGDGNRDRIREMGWRFDAADRLTPDGFLTGGSNTWMAGARLVQFDHAQYRDARDVTREGRTPGVLSARVGDCRVAFGVKDFWQRFPNELEFESRAFTFYNWPRHNPPAFSARPTPIAEAYRLRFAHEGERLDFRLPEEYVQDPIWSDATQNGREANWSKGRVESVNAQGIARTEEMFLYLAEASVTPDQAARVVRGLIDETVRAVVDPPWTCASGALGAIRHQDRDAYAEEERIFEEICHAPARWNERLAFYGKWLHGDLPVNSVDLAGKSVSTSRTLKKNHHGWPFKWVPYARSGDPALLKYAEAANRQMIDANFCHYVSADVDRSVGPEWSREQGWWETLLFPWAGHGGQRRGICIDCDYLWQAYYLTGFQRSRDVALLWADVVKIDTARILTGRISTSNLHSYLDMYKATFDPWFLVAAHEIARLHKAEWGGEGPPDKFTSEPIGHFWKPGDRDFFAFTGDEDHRRVALNIAVTWSSPWAYNESWNRLGVPYIQESTAAYDLTGDPFHLARAAAYVDGATASVFDGAVPEYMKGVSLRWPSGTPLELFTGWYLQQFPLALAAFERAGMRPEPVPNPFFQRPAHYTEVEADGRAMWKVRSPDIVFRKTTPAALPLRLDTWDRKDVTFRYRIAGSDGRTAAAGDWPLKTGVVAELPPGTPAGIYRLSMEGLHPAIDHSGAGTFLVPAARPEVPEVMAFERTTNGTEVGLAVFESQYWFRVPKTCVEFWVEFRHPGLRRTIWNPAGKRAWDIPATGEGAGPAKLRAVVKVPPEHAGKLWRITCPGWNFGFVMDPAIPPYFSVSRAKWFNPEE